MPDYSETKRVFELVQAQHTELEEKVRADPRNSMLKDLLAKKAVELENVGKAWNKVQHLHEPKRPDVHAARVS